MPTNNYKIKANSYAYHKRDEGTVILAYRELGNVFARYVTSDRNKALDFGSGTGRSRKYLEEVGFNADGVDIDPYMIEKAKDLDRSNKDRYKLISNSTIPHRSSKYDLVFSSLVVLEIGSKAEIAKYFSEAYRVMRFDGTFIVLTVNNDFYKYPWYSVDTNYPGNKTAKSGDKVRIKIKEIDLELDDFYWTKEDYRDIATQEGFTILEEIEPKGNSNDGVLWLTEKDIAPFVIFVMKKTKSLENISTIAKRNSLDIHMPNKSFFSEVFRSDKIIKKEELIGFSGDRSECSKFKLLIPSGSQWFFHRLKSEESLIHIDGNDLLIHCVDPNGNYTRIYLGEEHENAIKDYTIPAFTWFAQEVCGKKGYTLIEGLVKPGFSPDDQESINRSDLLNIIDKRNDEAFRAVIKCTPNLGNEEKFFSVKKIYQPHMKVIAQNGIA